MNRVSARNQVPDSSRPFVGEGGSTARPSARACARARENRASRPRPPPGARPFELFAEEGVVATRRAVVDDHDRHRRGRRGRRKLRDHLRGAARHQAPRRSSCAQGGRRAVVNKWHRVDQRAQDDGRRRDLGLDRGRGSRERPAAATATWTAPRPGESGRVVYRATARGVGMSDHSRSSSTRPCAFEVRPPHCLKKKATSASAQRSRSRVSTRR